MMRRTFGTGVQGEGSPRSIFGMSRAAPSAAIWRATRGASARRRISVRREPGRPAGTRRRTAASAGAEEALDAFGDLRPGEAELLGDHLPRSGRAVMIEPDQKGPGAGDTLPAVQPRRLDDDGARPTGDDGSPVFLVLPVEQIGTGHRHDTCRPSLLRETF